MRLLYIWVEEYKHFKNKEFNLNSKYRFKFNIEKKELSCEKEVNYIKDFFINDDSNSDNIKDIIAIVGNNGSGKSTVLEMIPDIVDTIPHRGKKYIAITQDFKNDISVLTNVDNLKELTVDKRKIIPITHQSFINEMKFIYHSNMLDYKHYSYNGNTNINDISSARLLYNSYVNTHSIYNKEVSYKVDSNRIFFHEEFKRQIKFIAKYKQHNSLIEFSLPTKLSMTFEDKYNYIKENLFKSSIGITDIKNNKSNSCDEKAPIDLFEDIIFQFKLMADGQTGIGKFRINYFKYAIFNFLIEDADDRDIDISKSDLLKNIHQCISRGETDRPGYVLLWIIDAIKKSNPGLYKFKNQVNIKRAAILEKINTLDFKIEYYANEKHLLYKLDIDKGIEITEFYNLYIQSSHKFEFINFSWETSSGENNLLNLFARFYDVKTRVYNKTNKLPSEYITILIDEADLSFHPEWQRRYIKYITTFLRDIFSGYWLHIIIATHSPIILSDMPKNNVIYLEKKGEDVSVDKKDINTFAANIYNLYNNSFFFEEYNNFGIIGEFSYKKIKYIIKEFDEIAKTINRIYNELDSHKNKIKYYKKLEEDMVKEKERLNKFKQYIDKIGEEFTRLILIDKYQNIKNTIDEINQILTSDENKNVDIEDKNIEFFENLSEDEQNKLIKYIIEKKK